MKTNLALLLIFALLLTGCNNFIHDLIPEGDDTSVPSAPGSPPTPGLPSSPGSPSGPSSPPSSTIVLSVTAPSFSDVTLGYAQPAADSISISNRGSSTALISSVAVSPDDAFTIDGSGDTIAAGGSIDTWTIQPEASLAPGTHTATITATYNGTGSTTATATVSIKVTIPLGMLYIVYTDGSSEMVTVSGSTYTLPVNSKTFYSFTFNAADFPDDPILIGRPADGTPVNLDFEPASPYALKFRAAVGGKIPINTYAEFQLINTAAGALNGNYVQETGLDLLGDTTGTGGPQPIQQNWTPIGPQATPFAGSFDGDGKSISNLYINTTGYAGLFGNLKGSLEDIHINAGSSVSGSAAYVGGICGGGISGSTIKTCTNAGTVSGSGERIGGICGGGGGGTITDCSNAGTVSGTGGGDYVGGISGGFDGTIKDCHNTGNVSGASALGGISSGSGIGGGTVTIIACYNTGNVTSTGSTLCVGGISGGFGNVTACYNTGTVSGAAGVGGISGYNYYTTITACYNTGTVSGAGGVGGVGGICGSGASGTITACYNTGTVSGTTGVGGIIGSNGTIVRGTIAACYWLDRPDPGAPTYGIGDNASDTNAAKFSSTAWPTGTHTQWGIGTGGSGGYWKSSGSWNGGAAINSLTGANTEFPKLYWEP